MIESRMRIYMIMLDKNTHPISHLQWQLGGGEHLRHLPKLNIEPITNTTLHPLYKTTLTYYSCDRWLLDTDMIPHNKFLHSGVKHVIMDIRHNSIENNALRRRRINTVGETITLANDITSWDEWSNLNQ